ncbi:hypothetical protein PIB30_019029 [Stylosanthes scabra]|uniref:TIR domain-containing protein n=1 Tax=Stylosanthes scabra TaxID=79078 RepID=A0ABU6R8F7_9FABA|nr:hypothetical protein [Stylosanthes scabra]
MALHASLSSSSFNYGWTFDVFLSFRGIDARHGFTGNLYNILHAKGIQTFFDDDKLPRGTQITPFLSSAIENSRIAIVVLSQNYAASSFCLDELTTILECVKGNGRLVLPIFYDVDPSDVRHQRGSYGEALARFEERFKDYDKEKVHQWRQALHQVANLSGQHFKLGNEYEYDFIQKVARDICNKINRVPLYVANYPVGLKSRVLEVNKLLNDGPNDGVHMAGIYGIGGIGKTTLARAVYNLISDQFEGLCFLENVRENANKYGLEHLQEMLLCKILGEKDIKLASASEGISVIKHRLCRKRVLLILDDVNKQQQLQKLVGGLDWFGSGSRVLITTRDKHLLACHGVERTYELNGLSWEDSINLFKWNAFKSNQVDPGFKHIINDAVTYSARLPLALEVIGSNLYGKTIEEWKSALNRYKRIPERDILEILKTSYDALEEDAQNVFLDIACCFKGFHLTEVTDILRAHHGICPKHAIGVLVDRNLMKVNQNGKVTIHDLIEEMGKEIVRQEGKPGQRSRLWFPKDVVHVLEDNEGTHKIGIIYLDLSNSKEKVVDWDGKAFKDMKSLKTLIIRNACFSQGPRYLPNSLRVLEWWGYPSDTFPIDFRPKKLVMCKLPTSHLLSFNLLEKQKEFVNLRDLIFDGAEHLTSIPNLSCAPNLKKLSFAKCENLIEIDESVGFLGKLKILDAEGCSTLRKFPPLMLTSLEELYLSHCSSLQSFPEILGKMENVTWLSFQNTAIKELPFSIGNLTRLQGLDLDKNGIVQFPSSITQLPELIHVSIRGSLYSQNEEGEVERRRMRSLNKSVESHCNMSDEIFPTVFAWFTIDVEELELSRLDFTVLPACITECLRLKKLKLDQCYNLREIKGLPPNLETLCATACRSLQALDLTIPLAATKEYHSLRRLILDNCKNLQVIKGIPPNIEVLSARNCTSLTYSCRNMLLNQELHEEGGSRWLLMPGSRIPEWFQHQSSGWKISFWFRNMLFPAISLCFVCNTKFYFCAVLKINDTAVHKWQLTNKGCWSAPVPEVEVEADHIFILDDKHMKSNDMNQVLLQSNEWNHAEVSIVKYPEGRQTLIDMQTGISIFKEKGSVDDIRFTDPYNKRIHDHVYWDWSSMASAQTSSTSNVKGNTLFLQNLISGSRNNYS